MDVQIAEERAFVLQPSIGFDQARERAWSQKLNVFGTLHNLMFRPKDDEVRITRYELRYEPFWHVSARSELEYDIRESYRLLVTNPATHHVSLEMFPDSDLVVQDQQVVLTGTSRCHESQTREQVLDGVTGEERPKLAAYLHRTKTELGTLDDFAPTDAVVVAPEIKASYVVRQQLTHLMRAVQADHVITETVEVSALALFFRPVYVFDYVWAPKDKRQTMALDGVSGELSNTTRQVGAFRSARLDTDLLFDIGADAVGMLVPGGSIAMKLGRLAVQRTRPGQSPPAP
ncbi:hypothetical protein [Microlunatus sp. Y2014]|uniref:hypothetical protein n=1 Tax=Microlunatus sp. Y2014 TaxID=3418488 RepID=UPI003DA6F132